MDTSDNFVSKGVQSHRKLEFKSDSELNLCVESECNKEELPKYGEIMKIKENIDWFIIESGKN